MSIWDNFAGVNARYISMSRRRVATSFLQCLVRPLCSCLVKKINQAQMFTELPASSFSIMCSQARMYDINYIERR